MWDRVSVLRSQMWSVSFVLSSSIPSQWFSQWTILKVEQPRSHLVWWITRSIFPIQNLSTHSCKGMKPSQQSVPGVVGKRNSSLRAKPRIWVVRGVDDRGPGETSAMVELWTHLAPERAGAVTFSLRGSGSQIYPDAHYGIFWAFLSWRVTVSSFVASSFSCAVRYPASTSFQYR